LGNINLEELSEYRKISESATAMWAAQRGTEEDMAALQDLLNQMETDIRNEEYDKVIDLDMEFHGLIAKTAKNQVSIVMNKTFSELNRAFIKNKVNKLQPSGQKKMILRIFNMHKSIFAAVQERDAEKAKKAMQEHLDAFEND
jgi:GntR family transcriptional repressor for pyruvate dehydrogenase complex